MLHASKFSTLNWCRSYSFRSSRIRYYYPLSKFHLGFIKIAKYSHQAFRLSHLFKKSFKGWLIFTLVILNFIWVHTRDKKHDFLEKCLFFLEKAHSFIRKTQLFKQSNRAAKTCFFKYSIFFVYFLRKKTCGRGLSGISSPKNWIRTSNRELGTFH